jgi:hypothetical protein
MKKDNLTPRFNRLVCLVIISAAVLLSGNLVSCKNADKEQANVTVNRVLAPVAMAFMDANRLAAAKVPNLKLTLIDDSGRVVTPNGLSFAMLNISDGFVSMALRDSTLFNNEKPYRFAIKAESPGYTTNYQTVVITQNKPQYIPVFMVKTDDPPTGVATFKGNIAVSGSMAISDLALSPNVSKLQNGKVSVKVDSGTVFLSNGEPLKDKTGNIAYTFSFASPDSMASRTFPGGQSITDAVDAGGKVLATPAKPILFTSAGWITLEMATATQAVTGFSKPVQLSLPIGKTLVNPTTSQPYRAGDAVPIWSLNDHCVWKQESTAIVKKSPDGELIATIPIQHLSTWNMDYPSNQCSTPVNIPYVNSSATAVTAYCEVRNATTGLSYGSHPSNTLTFSAGSGNQTLILGGTGVPGIFVMYDNPTGPGNVVASSNFTFCTGGTPSTLTFGGTYNSMPIDFFVQNATNQYPICNNAVFYQNSSLCGGSSAPLFGGFLQSTGVVGTVTLEQNSAVGAFAVTCIEMLYGGTDASGQTVAQTIEAVINLADHSPAPAKQAASTTVNGIPASQPITYQYNSTSGHMQVFIPAGIVTTISTCP